MRRIPASAGLVAQGFAKLRLYAAHSRVCGVGCWLGRQWLASYRLIPAFAGGSRAWE